MNSVLKISVIAGCSTLFALALKKLFAAEKNNKTSVNDVLVYNAKDDSTTENNLSRITQIICNAKSTVDVCMAKLTSSIVIDCLKSVIQKGAMVRIIIHSDCTIEDLLYLQELCNAGAQSKAVDPEERLDYEIIIIDGSMKEVSSSKVALVGALNYTFEDLNEQYDSTLITSELSIVNKLQVEFDRLWDSIHESIIINA